MTILGRPRSWGGCFKQHGTGVPDGGNHHPGRTAQGAARATGNERYADAVRADGRIHGFRRRDLCRDRRSLSAELQALIAQRNSPVTIAIPRQLTAAPDDESVRSGLNTALNVAVQCSDHPNSPFQLGTEAPECEFPGRCLLSETGRISIWHTLWKLQKWRLQE